METEKAEIVKVEVGESGEKNDSDEKNENEDQKSEEKSDSIFRYILSENDKMTSHIL